MFSFAKSCSSNDFFVIRYSVRNRTFKYRKFSQVSGRTYLFIYFHFYLCIFETYFRPFLLIFETLWAVLNQFKTISIDLMQFLSVKNQ